MKKRVQRVQIVEDDTDLSVLLSQQLQYLGCETREWTEKFELLCDREPWLDVDALVMDLWLRPDGFENGFSLATTIVRYVKTHFPRIICIVYTAVPRECIPEELVDLADRVLGKPLNTAVLVGALNG